MTNIENTGKHVAKMPEIPGVLTYNALTDNPAKFLRVAVPFSENMSAQVCGSRHPLENNDPRADGNPSEGLTLTHRGAQMAASIIPPGLCYLNTAPAGAA